MKLLIKDILHKLDRMQQELSDDDGYRYDYLKNKEPDADDYQEVVKTYISLHNDVSSKVDALVAQLLCVDKAKYVSDTWLLDNYVLYGEFLNEIIDTKTHITAVIKNNQEHLERVQTALRYHANKLDELMRENPTFVEALRESQLDLYGWLLQFVTEHREQ